MRPDQLETLQALTEKLTDVFLQEVDPDKWPGGGVELADMNQQTRGDRYWSKKNCAATLTVIMKTVNLVGVIQQSRPPGDDTEDQGLDAEIKAAEKEATKLINKLQSGQKAHAKK